MVRRIDLADFLKARRAAISPAQAGLPPGARRRTPGLRREEVSALAGVSTSWYTWLEQGRPINVSVEVLDSLARVLALDPVERDHLAMLAGHHSRPASTVRVPVVPGWVHRLLATLDSTPAYLMGPTWDYLAWNEAQAQLFPPLADLSAADRNLVWAMFALPETRALIVDWEDEARRLLSQFRADTTPIRDDPAVVGLVDRLRSASPEFDRWWGRHDVAGFQTRLRHFRHPTMGELTLEYQQLVVAGEPDLRLVVQLPVDPA